MTAGFDLKEGSYIRKEYTASELWDSLETIFTNKSRNDTSYKYGYLISLIKSFCDIDPEGKLTFDQIFMRFSEIYWNLVSVYGIMQKKITKDGRAAAIDRIILNVKYERKFYQDEKFTNLDINTQSEILNKVKENCKKYVIGAVFEDTNRCFYDFSKKEEYIKLNPQMMDLILKNKVVVTHMTLYSWARFLESINTGTSSTGIIEKLESSVGEMP